MKELLNRIKDKFLNGTTLYFLVITLIVVLILHYLSGFIPFFNYLYQITKVVLFPFIIGFAIAYILRPIIVYFEKKGITRKYVIPILIIGLLVFIWWLIMSIFPMAYDEIVQFVKNGVESINAITEWYLNNSDNPSDLFNQITNQLVNFLNNVFVPNITLIVSDFISSLLSIFTITIFSIVIAVYIMFDYERFSLSIYQFAKVIHKELPDYMRRVDHVVSVYIRSLLLLMIIKFFEYSLLYNLIGHKNAMILGLLTSIGLLVPYIGPMLANAVGILTSLTLPLPNIIILIVAIGVLSMVDEYVVTPAIHSKNSEVKPLWSMFSVFVGSYLLGPLGIMIAVPAYMSIREIIKVYREKHHLEVEGV